MPGLVPSGDGITVRQLLNHTSGLYNYTEDLPDPAGIVRGRFDHWEPHRALAAAFAHEPLFAPGSCPSRTRTATCPLTVGSWIWPSSTPRRPGRPANSSPLPPT
ncbi:beta-lactamase family protein [Streptomyces sp. SID13031]|nr:beta-lactamase family protein [Streptomyces sp. SID13031]